jgi:hypothetical protein
MVPGHGAGHLDALVRHPPPSAGDQDPVELPIGPHLLPCCQEFAVGLGALWRGVEKGESNLKKNTDSTSEPVL